MASSTAAVNSAPGYPPPSSGSAEAALFASALEASGESIDIRVIGVPPEIEDRSVPLNSGVPLNS